MVTRRYPVLEKKKAIYSRKSKFTGKGESINNQIEMCKNYAKLHLGVTNDDDFIIYEDEGFSGGNIKRPKLQEMLKDIRNRKIDTLLFYKLDRISRNVTDFCNLKMELEKYDVKFYSVSENFDNATPGGNAMMMMTSVFAELERNTIAERIRDNMLELAKTGRWLGGNTPLGYKSTPVERLDSEGKKRKLFKLDIIDEECETVKLIFQKYLLLKSQTKLETYLINNDMKTKKGIHFSRFALKSILQNPVYAVADKEMYQYFASNKVEVFNDEEDFNGTGGIMAYNKTEQKSNKTTKKRELSEWIVAIGKHKGLIDGKDWVEVQNILEGNKNKRYRMPGKNNALLSGIIHCSQCGSFMRPKLRTSFYKNNEIRFVYMCELKEKSRKGKCQCKDAPGNEIDEQVIQAIKDVVKTSSTFYQKLKKAINENFNKIEDENKEMNILRNQYHKNEQEISNLIDRMKYVDVCIVSELSSEIVKLKEKNVEIEKNIAKLKESSVTSTFDSKEQAKIVLSTIDNFVPNFEHLDILQKRTLIKMLISSVETNGEDLIINFVGSRNKKDNSLVPLCEDTK